MTHPRRAVMVIATLVSALYVVGIDEAHAESIPATVSFLKMAAGGQQHEIELGQLAMQKAGNEQVKQFGTRMVQDHRKALQEVRQLATKTRMALGTEPSEQHQQQKAQLSKLSGKEFDRAYIMFMLRDHTKNMKHFGQHALVEPNPEVRQWTASALPVIKEHLEKVKTIGSSLGIDPAP
jgi:putative membrane protein